MLIPRRSKAHRVKKDEIEDLFIFHQITDTHVIEADADTCLVTDTGKDSIKYFCSSAEKVRQFVADANFNAPDFVVHTGDMVEASPDYEYFMNIWNDLNITNAITIGNHDRYASTTEQIATAVGYGAKTANAGSKFNQSYSLQNAKGNVNVKVIVLDGTNGGTLENYWYEGRCTSAEQTWVANEIANATENIVLIFLHHPPHMYDQAEPQFNQAEAFALKSIIDNAVISNPSLKIHTFFGHHHGEENYRKFDNLGSNFIGYLNNCATDFQTNWVNPVGVNSKGKLIFLPQRELKYNY